MGSTKFYNFVSGRILPWVVFFMISSGLGAEFSLQVLGARSGGEFVFETGNRFPNLSGLTGGSRISFDRDYNLGGVAGKWVGDRLEVSGKYTTTGWYVHTGRARDEDFFLYSVSKERAHHVQFNELSYYDSTNVYSGTRNFADGIGKSSMTENNLEFMTRYYLGEARGNIHSSGDGFFLSGGIRYTYNKYIFYDVNQWVGTVPVFYQPIGYGLSFSNDIWEFPFGFGYRWNYEKFYLDGGFQVLVAYIKSRDFHKQRNINFFSETFGYGILANMELGYKFTNKISGFLRLNQHRFFTKGSFHSVGGLTRDDILSNYVGRFKAHINTKEWTLEFGSEIQTNWL